MVAFRSSRLMLLVEAAGMLSASGVNVAFRPAEGDIEDCTRTVALRQYALSGTLGEESSRSALRRLTSPFMAGGLTKDSPEFESFQRFQDGRCLSQTYAQMMASWDALATNPSCLPSSSMGVHLMSEGSVANASKEHISSVFQKQHWPGAVYKLDFPTFENLMASAKVWGSDHPGRGKLDTQEGGAPGFAERFSLAKGHRDESLIARLISELVAFLGGSVTDEEAMFRAVPHYFGADIEFGSMATDILDLGNAGNQWIRFGGEHAPLNQVGLAAIRRYKSKHEMESFLQRVIASMGMIVQNNDALNIFIRFYNGDCASRDYDTLVSELKAAADAAAFCGGGWLLRQVPIGMA